MKKTRFFITLLASVAVMLLVGSCDKDSDEDPVFTVTVSNDGHGTDSSNVASAAAGATITLTATPAAGYIFKQWVVVSGGITLSNVSPTTFIMPAGNVSVRAEFEANGLGTGGVSDFGNGGVYDEF